MSIVCSVSDIKSLHYRRFDCSGIYVSVTVSVNVFSVTVLIDDTVLTSSENGTTISAWSSEPWVGLAISRANTSTFIFLIVETSFIFTCRGYSNFFNALALLIASTLTTFIAALVISRGFQALCDSFVINR